MKRAVKQMLARVGYRIEGTRYIPRHLLDAHRLRMLEFDDIICRHMFEFGEHCTFIQVGAYDGVSTDPLRKYINRCGWRGVMLEPQPQPASQLRELYRANDNIVILQAAVDCERRKRTLYTIESDIVPKWVGGMASFERAQIIKHSYLVPDLETLIKEVSVDCVRFEDAIEYLPSQRLDLLQVDVEGADSYILSLFPYERIRPRIIQWESKNLTKSQKEDVFELLASYSYRFAPSGGEDTLAVLDEQAFLDLLAA